MAKDFPDSSLAYKPSAPDDTPMPTVIKIVPTTPASQSDRPQLRAVVTPSGG